MLVKLERTFQNKVSTVGEMFVDDKHICVALEDGWHMAKLPGITRIPAGTYPLKLNSDPKSRLHNEYAERFGLEFHKGMLQICDVPGYEGVMIHCGNTVEHTRGCPLTGSEVIMPPLAGDAYKVHGSEKAYRELYPPVALALIRNIKCWFQAIDPKFEGVTG